MSYILAFFAEFSCFWTKIYISYLEAKATKWEQKAKNFRAEAAKEREFAKEDCPGQKIS